MAPKSRDFHDFLSFLESDQGASRKYLGYVGRVLEWLRVSWTDFRASIRVNKNGEIFEIFRFQDVISDWSSARFQLQGMYRALYGAISMPPACECRAWSRWKGSTSHSARWTKVDGLPRAPSLGAPASVLFGLFSHLFNTFGFLLCICSMPFISYSYAFFHCFYSCTV